MTEDRISLSDEEIQTTPGDARFRQQEDSDMGDDTKDWTPGSGPAGPSRRDPSTG